MPLTQFFHHTLIRRVRCFAVILLSYICFVYLQIVIERLQKEALKVDDPFKVHVPPQLPFKVYIVALPLPNVWHVLQLNFFL